MKQKNLLGLLALSAILTPILSPLSATQSLATERTNANSWDHPLVQASCDSPETSPLKTSGFKHPRTILVAASVGIPGEDTILDFSEAESDAAVTLFGCDCPACMRSLKQLQSQSLTQKVLGSGGKGHCWTALQKKASPETVKKVLQTLENQKIN